MFYRQSKKKRGVPDHSIHPLESGERESDLDFACARDWQLLTLRQATQSSGRLFTHGCNVRFRIFRIYSYRTCWLSVVMLVRQFIFCLRNTFLEKVFFFQYFYLSKIFRPYFHFYLSKIFRPYYYFYLSIN